jgi:hypothetical protein
MEFAHHYTRLFLPSRPSVLLSISLLTSEIDHLPIHFLHDDVVFRAPGALQPSRARATLRFA